MAKNKTMVYLWHYLLKHYLNESFNCIVLMNNQYMMKTSINTISQAYGLWKNNLEKIVRLNDDEFDTVDWNVSCSSIRIHEQSLTDPMILHRYHRISDCFFLRNGSDVVSRALFFLFFPDTIYID
jgi:hypothetical protein